ncbi:MAG: dihydrolipoamide acetyltransferase family protein [Planctomycetota bacterium]|jgi:pyruvate dehydrogenase E2 component (dihydrolipoamide acetyltransferase)
MAKEVRLPQLGQTMEEGTIVECMVNVDDKVTKGDVLFAIETDKATLEVESPADGFIKKILVEVDQTLPVGEPLVILGEKDEEVSQDFVNSLQKSSPVEPVPGTAAAVTEPPPVQLEKEDKATRKVIASPRAKKLAKELSVDLSSIAGTGPGGKITEDDVKKATGEQTAPPIVSIEAARLGTSFKINKLQQLTAQRMLNSKREIPCFYLNAKIDVTKLVEERTRLNEKGDVKISYNDFLIKAFALGLEKFPVMTGQLEGDVIKLAQSINIGLAVEAPNGLIVPVIKDAQKKDLTQIACQTKELADKAKNENLDLTDLEGACITISNLGAFGIESFIPIVIPGQCSIVGVGQITDTCMPNNNDIAVRKMMNINLSVDHKVVNGAYASQFLDYVKKLLRDPSAII